jgi:hypothetical protein
MKVRQEIWMGDEKYHAKLAREKRTRSLNELVNRRYATVAILALRSVEEAVDACASRKKLHFHADPKTAHAKRGKWLKKEYPELAKPFNTLRGTYEYFRSHRHLLGYERVPIFLAWWWRFPTPEYGRRAANAAEAMEKILDVLQKETGIKFK